MAPKTERLEMRLDADTIERMDAWRTEQDDVPSRSEAVRRLLEVGLEANTKEGFRLSKSERLMTWMLSEIMKNQIEARGGKDAKHDMESVRLIQQSLYGGHFWALIWEMTGVMHDHVDNPKAVRTVVDTLDMWQFIERAYAGFDDAEKKRIETEVPYRGKHPKFIGFDGNNEGEYYSIARFLIEELNRFQDFKGRSLNSHSPQVGRYQRMAAAFDPIRAKLVGREMTSDEVIELLKID